MLILTSILALYVAWNLGANDVANSMGTSVGSKAVTLRQALIIAGVLEFTGAVLFGREVSATIATQIVDLHSLPTLQTVAIGMVSVLIAGGIWLNVATLLGLPVSATHATIGAIAGFATVAAGVSTVAWSQIGMISLTWVVTPIVSSAIAALFYSLLKSGVLDQAEPSVLLREWLPWLSAAMLSIFGVIVLPTVSQPLQGWFQQLHLPPHDLPLLLGTIAAAGLTFYGWRTLEQAATQQPELSPPVCVELVMSRFQLLSACFVAFAHGSNDVGNAVAPLAVLAEIQRTGRVPSTEFTVPLWILALGGLGIVAGLAVLGKRVIATIGETIIPLQPSSGFCAELATATTVLLASRWGLPVSTSHALVGGVVGVGLVREFRAIQWQTLRSIGLAWFVTLPVAAGLSAATFAILRRIAHSAFIYLNF
jgi:PiT family inorganic phosphate transporter